MRAWLLPLPLVLAACPTGGGPCSDDANQCRDGGTLEIDAACELSDALVVELGEGEGVFRPLAPGESPSLTTGIQGGQHMILGVGVDNPSLDHLAFEVEVVLAVDTEGEVETVGERTVVYGADLVHQENGRAELLDLVVFPNGWPDSGRRWISVNATDSCGRRGQVDHALD